jgi:PAS domain S-box-containing protein
MVTRDDPPEKLSEIYRRIDELKARASKYPDHVEAVLSSAFEVLEANLEELSQQNEELAEAAEENRRLLTAVQEERDKLSALVNSINDEVWFADTQKRFTLANPSALREFGLSSDEEIDVEKLATSLEVYRPDESPRPVEEAPPLRAIQGEVIKDQEEMIRTPATGELRYRQVSAGPVRDATGNIIGSVSVVHDITDYKRMEKDLAHLASFPQLNPNPIVEVDQEGCVHYLNNAAQKLFPDLQEKGPNHPWLTDWKQMSRMFLKSKPQECVRDILIGGIWYQQSIYSIPESKRIRIYGLDITNRKKMEEELLENEQRYATTLASIGDAVIATDIEGKITFMNKIAEELTGWTLHEASMKPAKEVFNTINEHTRQKVDDPITKVLENGMIVGLANHTILIRKDETEVAIDDSGAPIKDRNGNTSDVVLVFRDITNRRQAETRINRQNVILNAINRVYEEAIRCETMEDLGQACLDIVESITSSKFSFIGEIGPDGLHHDIAISNPGWELCTMSDKTGHRRPPGNFEIRGLYGRVLQNGQSLLTNNPSSHPDSIGVPEGHPRLTAFLGVPFIRDGKAVGLISVGNREGGYSSEDRDILDALTPTILEAILRKRAEETLKENQAVLKAVIESTPDHISLKDREGRYVMVNSAAAKSLNLSTGISAAEIIGKKDDDILSSEIACQVMDDDRQVITSGEMLAFDQSFTIRNDTRFFSTIKSPYHDIAGNVVGVVNVSRDITEHKRREKRIAKLSQLYAVLSRVNETIVRTQDEGSLYSHVCQIVAEEGGYPLVWIGEVKEQQVVPAAWFGTAADYLKEIQVEVQGELSRGPTGSCIREDRSIINDNFATNPATLSWRKPALRYGFNASAAFPLHRQGKAVGTFTLYAYEPNAFDEEQVVLLESLSSDISYALDAFDREQLRLQTEQALDNANEELERRVQERTEELAAINEELRKEIEDHERTESDLLLAKEAAEAAVDTKAAFLANMSHELRTPMNSVIGFSSILLDESLTPEQEEYVEGIRKGGEALLTVINDILEFSRTEKDKIELEHQPFSLKQLIDESLDLVAVQASEKGLNLSQTINYGTPDTIVGDHGRLRQILVNLLSNAVKFTDNGDVSMSVSSKVIKGNQSQIFFEIKDTGIGISQDKMNEIYEPFAQVERTISLKRDGVGLGLAITKNLVDLMSGTIWTESILGQGTTFRVMIPAETIPGKQFDSGKVDRGVASKNVPGLKPIRILIAEDNPSNQRVLVEMLKRLGYRADAVADGKEVIQAIERQDYDLVLMDIKMPEMDGITATQVIRKLLPDNGPKIIAITAFTLEGDREKCLEAGMDGYIAKPVKIDDLATLLVQYCHTIKR